MKEIPNYRTLTEALIDRARTMPDKVAFEFIKNQHVRASISYLELHQKAARIASTLVEIAKPGDRVLLPCTSSLDFHISFCGCLYAGMVAVPLPLPNARRNSSNTGLDRFIAVVEDSSATVALFSEEELQRLSPVLTSNSDLAGLTIMSVDKALDSTPMLVSEIQAEPDTLVFLQYSSGSTSTPKGVMLTHANIVANQNQIQTRFQFPENVTMISWLPLYHDMGMCSGFFLGIHLGAHVVLMKPISFVARPLTWLEEIARHEWVVSGGPNFAYAWCTSKIKDEELSNIDLSGWKLAYNGAEPIQASTMTTFAARFAPTGFLYDSFFPCYGMAEATLFVTGSEPGAKPEVSWFDKHELGRNHALPIDADSVKGTQVVGCGKTAGDAHVAIVDPKTRCELENGDVGEIWVSTPSAGIGYWNAPELSCETFGQVIQTQPENRYFRTGDLGFVHKGDLYVTGRIKELIIVNGVNYYPQDIERIARSVCPNLRVTSAFAIGQEPDIDLILVAEVNKALMIEEDEKELISRISKAVNDEFQLSLQAVILSEPNTIPRTTSGKIQRGLCAQMYKRGLFTCMSQKALKVA